MPKKRRDLKEVRTQIATAAEQLRKDGKIDLADAVAYALTDDYFNTWRYRKYETTPAATNMPIHTRDTTRHYLQVSARRAGTTLTKLADEALLDFVTERFTPSKPKRVKRDTKDKAVNINVRPDPSLLADAVARCEVLEEEEGLKVRPSQVVLQYMLHKFPMPDADPMPDAE